MMSANVRLTLDMTEAMYRELTASIEKVSYTKSQYMRAAIEVLNMLVQEQGAQILIKNKNNETRQLFIPGISVKS